MRGVPHSYAELHGAGGWSVDRPKARAQHHQVRTTLEACGVDIRLLTAIPELPDSVFIEDPVLVWDGAAILARPRPPRDPEPDRYIDQLPWGRPHARIEPPGFLEGGDVLDTDRETLVGLSSRTDPAGAEQLAGMLEETGRSVRTVRVNTERYLHLKSGASYLGDGVILAAPDAVEPGAFGDYRVLTVPEEEWRAANVLRIGDDVIVPAGRERTRGLIASAVGEAVTIREVDISEFEKGGGSLSCLSVLW